MLSPSFYKRTHQLLLLLLTTTHCIMPKNGILMITIIARYYQAAVKYNNELLPISVQEEVEESFSDNFR